MAVIQAYQSCKICGSHQLRTIKTYHITQKEIWPWDEVYAIIKDTPFPLTIRLGLCQSCGFLFYLDTLTYPKMKYYYEQEARYKRPKEHKIKPGRLWELDSYINFIHNNLPSGVKTALDLGAGDFVALERLQVSYPTIIFEAVDPSYPKDNHNSIKVYRTMIEDFPTQKRYDLVTAVHILEHVGELHDFMKPVTRLVNTKGHLYVEVPFQVGPSLFLNRSASAQHINYFTPETLRYLLSKHGFHVIASEFDTGSYSRNGMLGMIRLLAQKKPAAVIKPKSSATLRYLFNPLPMVRRNKKALA